MIKRSVLCQLVGQEGTKHHKFLKNYCLQHVWKAIHGKKGLSDHNGAIHTEVESPCAMFVTKYSESKSNWHATFGKHM